MRARNSPAGRPVRRPLAALLTLIAFGAFAALGTFGEQARAASRPGRTAFPTGFVDDGLFEYPVGTTAARAMARAGTLGGSWIRLPAAWSSIAPASEPDGFDASDPASDGYTWTVLDNAVRAAAAQHQKVLMQITGPPPAWLIPAGHTASYEPNPTGLGQFAEAVARRYSGVTPDPLRPGGVLPRVSHFQIWNEPNLPGALTPQWTKTAHGYRAASPIWYRMMLNDAYAGITAIDPTASVLAAGLEPYGDAPGGERMRPLTFDATLLCLHYPALTRAACAAPAHLTGLDDHPYSINPTIHAFNALDTSVPDVHKLGALLGAARRHGTALPNGPKSVWVTEIAWGTKPPRTAGITTALQARYYAYTMYELWKQRVNVAMWFTMEDPGPALSYIDGDGVLFHNGAPKPSAAAARFPFVAVPGGGGTILWGRAPQPGAVTIAERSGGMWKTVAHLRTTSGGIFYTVSKLPKGSTLEAVQSGVASEPFHAVVSASGK